MSLNLLRITLANLTRSDSVLVRAVLKDSFTLIEHLINTKNVDLLVRTLLASALWDQLVDYEFCHELMYATRFLSSEKATQHQKCIIKAIRETQCSTWRKSAMLAALTYAEMRGIAASELSWLSSKGKFGAAFIRSVVQDDGHTSQCALLVLLSYVWSKLSAYQQEILNDPCKVACLQALYESRMILDKTISPIAATKSFKELGLFTRTTSALCQNMSVISCETALDILCEASTIFDDKSIIDDIRKPLFLSMITVQQAILVAVLQHSLSLTQAERIAVKSLSILRNMQEVNSDNSVFESWRFCFSFSLDMLASEPKDLTEYLERLLQSSTLSENPLSTKYHKERYSKMRDEMDVLWVLTIVESTSTSINSTATLTRIFDHCFDKLVQVDDSESQETSVLYQSVILSLLTTKHNLFRFRVPDFITYVLQHSDTINDRQFKLIFTTLYRLSLTPRSLDESEDSAGILGAIKATLESSKDVVLKQKLLSTIIEMLPIVGPPFLLRNLRYTDHAIQALDNSQKLTEEFNDVCTTEMDSERAVVCTTYLLSRNGENLFERARL